MRMIRLLSGLPRRREIGADAIQFGEGSGQFRFGTLGAGAQFGAGVVKCGDLTEVRLTELLTFASGVGSDQLDLAVGSYPDPLQFGRRGFGRLPGAGRLLLGGADTDVGLCDLVLRGGDRAIAVLLSRLHSFGRGPLGLRDLRLGEVVCSLGSLLGGGLGGERHRQLRVGFPGSAEGLGGGGFGLLAQLGSAGRFGVSQGDLLGRLGLHRLDLRGRCLRVSSRVKLRGQVGKPACQGGYVITDGSAKLCGASRRHGDGPVQVGRLSGTTRLAG